MSLISKLMQLSIRKNVSHLWLVKDLPSSEGVLLGQVDTMAQSIWSRHDQVSESGTFQKGAVCAIGFEEGDTQRMRTWLRQVGLGPCASCVQVDQLQDLASPGHAFRYLVVNVDAFEDCDSAVNSLLVFRRHRPDTIVILVSAAVAIDDLGSERRMICDATLRAPLTLSRLKRGVSAAYENNAAMRLDTAIAGR